MRARTWVPWTQMRAGDVRGGFYAGEGDEQVARDVGGGAGNRASRSWEFLFTSNLCRPGAGRGPIISRPQQVTKTWIPALEGDPIRGAGTTGILETQLSNTSSSAAFKGKTAGRVHQTLCIDLSHLKCFSPSRRNFYSPQISVAPAQAGAQFCSFQYAAKIRPRPAPGRQFCWCRAR